MAASVNGRSMRATASRRRSGVLVLLLVTGLVGAACSDGTASAPADTRASGSASGASSTTDDTQAAPTTAANDDPATTNPSTTTGPTTTAAPAEPSAADRYADVLIDSGIAIETGDAAGASPFAVPSWQLAALAADAATDSGPTGAALDELAPTPEGWPATSFLIAGWITSADTPGAVWAAAAMGERDWSNAPQIRFPAAVVNLFVHDVLASAGAPEAPPPEGFAPNGLRRPTALPPPGQPVCPLIEGWVHGQLVQLFTAAGVLAFTGVIPTPPGGWILVGGELQKLDPSAMAAALEKEWAADRFVVAEAFAILGTVGFLASLLTGWTTTVTPSAPADRFAIGTEPDRPQTFTATVSAPIPSWPTVITDCAAAVGIDLPDPSGAGSTALWTVTGLPQLGVETSRDATFDSAGIASLEWITGREPNDDRPPQVGVVEATVTVDVDARQKLTTLWGAAYNSAVSTQFLGPVVGWQASTSDLWANFDSVLEASTAPTATASVMVTHHPQCELVPGTLPDGTWTGPLEIAATGTPTVVEGSTSNVGGGSVTIVVDGGVVTGGEWVLDWTATGYASSDTATATVDGLVGHVGGVEVTGSASAPAFSGSVTLTGSIHIVNPVQYDIPLDGTSPASATMTLTDVSCTTATGTFIPSINENAGGFVVFTGEVTWSGTRSS